LNSHLQTIVTVCIAPTNSLVIHMARYKFYLLTHAAIWFRDVSRFTVVDCYYRDRPANYFAEVLLAKKTTKTPFVRDMSLSVSFEGNIYTYQRNEVIQMEA
jgi:hypothetical protein